MTNKTKEYLGDFHSNNIYIPSRTIMLTDEIDIDTYSEVIKNLHALDQTEGTVTIYLNSGGGSVVDGLAIYDAIKAMKNYVRIIVLGEACSAASFILQAADERIMCPSAHIMVHWGDESLGPDNPQSVKRWAERNQKLADTMVDIYLTKIKEKKPRFTKKKLHDMLNFDTILDSKEAVELGLADKALDYGEKI